MPEPPERLPVFDEMVGVDWSGCLLVERVAGRVSGVPTLRDSRLPADSIVSNFDAGETRRRSPTCTKCPSNWFGESSTTRRNIEATVRVLLDHNVPRQLAEELPNARPWNAT